MMPENNRDFDSQNQQLKSDGNGGDDRLQDTSNSDAAANNARQTERIQQVGRAAEPSFRLDENGHQANTGKENGTPEGTESESTEEDLSDETLSASTNLSLDQLKKEKDPGGLSSDDRPENPGRV